MSDKARLCQTKIKNKTRKIRPTDVSDKNEHKMQDIFDRAMIRKERRKAIVPDGGLERT